MNSLSFYLLPIVLLVGFTGNGTVLLDDVSNVDLACNREGLNIDIYGSISNSYEGSLSKCSKIGDTIIELTKSEQEVISQNAQKVKSDIRSKFERLHSDWYDASREDMRVLLSSSMYSRMEVPEFDKLLEMGEEIIPLVLEKMMDRKYFFTQVLYEALMGNKPILMNAVDNDVIRSYQDRAQLLVREWIKLYNKK